MKTLLTLFSLCVVFLACENMQRPLMKAVDDVVETQPTDTVVQPQPTDTVVESQPEIPAVTFDNALNLMLGERYRLIPTEYATSVGPLVDRTLHSVNWGNMTQYTASVVERADFPADAPKIGLEIEMDAPQPYAYAKDGAPIISRNLITGDPMDEIVIEISHKFLQQEDTAGPRGDKFTYTLVFYTGKVIGNLTHPDQVFEYEE